MKPFAIAGAVGMVAVAAASAAAGTASQATVYRCGSDGRTFSDRPCDSGSALVPKADVPDAARVREARQVAEREAALADRLATERRERDELPRGGIGGFHAKPVATVDKTRITPKRRRSAKSSAHADEAARASPEAPFEAKAASIRK